MRGLTGFTARRTSGYAFGDLDLIEHGTVLAHLDFQGVFAGSEVETVGSASRGVYQEESVTVVDRSVTAVEQRRDRARVVAGRILVPLQVA